MILICLYDGIEYGMNRVNDCLWSSIDGGSECMNFIWELDATNLLHIDFHSNEHTGNTLILARQSEDHHEIPLDWRNSQLGLKGCKKKHADKFHGELPDKRAANKNANISENYLPIKLTHRYNCIMLWHANQSPAKFERISNMYWLVTRNWFNFNWK